MIAEIIGGVMILGVLSVGLRACGSSWKETFITMITVVAFIIGLTLLITGGLF